MQRDSKAASFEARFCVGRTPASPFILHDREGSLLWLRLNVDSSTNTKVRWLARAPAARRYLLESRPRKTPRDGDERRPTASAALARCWSFPCGRSPQDNDDNLPASTFARARLRGRQMLLPNHRVRARGATVGDVSPADRVRLRVGSRRNRSAIPSIMRSQDVASGHLLTYSQDISYVSQKISMRFIANLVKMRATGVTPASARPDRLSLRPPRNSRISGLGDGLAQLGMGRPAGWSARRGPFAPDVRRR